MKDIHSLGTMRMATGTVAKEKKVMTDEIHEVKRLTGCPFCKNEHCNYGSFDLDNGTVTQEANCYKCEAEWTEFYNLVGYARDN